MTHYRVGTHHGITIVREGDGARCGRPDHDCQRGHLIAVVVEGGQALAEIICALLNDADVGSTQRCDYPIPQPDGTHRGCARRPHILGPHEDHPVHAREADDYGA